MGRACGKKLSLVGGHLYLTTPGERCSVHFLFVNSRASLRTVFTSIPKMFRASVTWTGGWGPNIFLFKHWMCLLAYQRQVTHMKHSVKDCSRREFLSVLPGKTLLQLFFFNINSHLTGDSHGYDALSGQNVSEVFLIIPH